ncbi:unnamed protein product [Pleuronectes platessa]|uniref:Integrase zinc-binding domain-containing protein n=1 Tax=Pleuronectes platessa TaxID=8262 RepID=A0A9N7TXB7_PLEPL|nr:unnamed protein product [Pleuronectes platessa]
MEKTLDAISLRYYWPGIEEVIRKWVLECPQCQARRNVLKIKKAYIPIEVTEPLELVVMDLVKLTPTKDGHHYISRYPTEVPQEYMVTDDGVEALIAKETQSLGMKSLPAHYSEAQAKMGKSPQPQLQPPHLHPVTLISSRLNLSSSPLISTPSPSSPVASTSAPAPSSPPRHPHLQSPQPQLQPPHLHPVTLISSRLNLSSSPLISSPVTLISPLSPSSPVTSAPPPHLHPVNLISSRLTVTPISSSVCPFRHFGNR